MSVVIRRRGPDHNVARFYAVALQGDLLDGWAVVREWGRIGSPGRVQADLCGTLEPARVAAERAANQKRGRGYR